MLRYIIALSFIATPAFSQQATDGDTIRIGEQRIRLSAIDAPELSQTCKDANGAIYLCGRDSRNFLRALIAGGIACRVESQDRYGRDVAACRTADGRDIGAAMVRAGHALPYWRYDGRRYAADYEAAQAAGAGMHAGQFIAPDLWRKGQRWDAR